MATFYSPNVVTDGLTVCLDAANARSYPGSGTSWYDLSGNGKTGTLVNGPTFDGGNGGSIVFDGTNDTVNTSYVMINGTDAATPITISFFINPDATQNATTNGPVWIGSAYYSGFGMRFGGSSYQIWLRMTSGTYTDTLPLTAGVFQHVVLIWGGVNDSKMYSYINGNLNSERSISYSAFNQSLTSYPFRFGQPYTSGGNTATGYFKGKIAQMMLYNRALSAAEVSQNFNALRRRFGV
jgi:hypothetical protein